MRAHGVRAALAGALSIVVSIALSIAVPSSATAATAASAASSAAVANATTAVNAAHAATATSAASLAAQSSTPRIAIARVACGEGATHVVVALDALSHDGPPRDAVATELELAIDAAAPLELRLPVWLSSELQSADLELLEPRTLAARARDGRAVSATWRGWERADVLERWSRAPLGVRARPRAAPPEERVAPSLAACAVLLALGCIALALRRAPRVAWIALALAALAVAWCLPPSGSATRRANVVWEIDAHGDRGLAWTSARDELAFDLERLANAGADAALLPRGARFDAVASSGPWTWHAAGARLWIAEELEGAAAAIAAHGGFELAWVRAGGASWQLRGNAEGADPPGWLLAGLPMGADLALGRLARAADGTSPGPWVRWVGPLDPRF